MSLNGFDWRERQSKYICNSVRVYDYFKCQWRMPLWDNEIMDFWSRVPVHLRIGRNLYYEYVAHKQKGLPFGKNGNRAEGWGIKDKLKKVGILVFLNDVKKLYFSPMQFDGAISILKSSRYFLNGAKGILSIFTELHLNNHIYKENKRS